MDEHGGKKGHENLVKAIGLLAGGLVVYEAATLMGANPGATGGGGGGGGGPPLTYNLYVAGAFVANYPSMAAADAYVNALPTPSVQETWQLFDSNGTLVQGGTIYPQQLVIQGYYVVYGPQNASSPTYPPTSAGLTQATNFINALPSGTAFTLFEITNQGLVQLSSGTKA
ncbi:MAG: hypothetical protein ACREQ5_03600 [Candidatus Dormibacteria bacterium]